MKYNSLHLMVWLFKVTGALTVVLGIALGIFCIWIGFQITNSVNDMFTSIDTLLDSINILWDYILSLMNSINPFGGDPPDNLNLAIINDSGSSNQGRIFSIAGFVFSFATIILTFILAFIQWMIADGLALFLELEARTRQLPEFLGKN